MLTASVLETIWKQPKHVSKRDWLDQSCITHKIRIIHKGIKRDMYMLTHTWKAFNYNGKGKVKNSIYSIIPSM